MLYNKDICEMIVVKFFVVDVMNVVKVLLEWLYDVKFEFVVEK